MYTERITTIKRNIKILKRILLGCGIINLIFLILAESTSITRWEYFGLLVLVLAMITLSLFILLVDCYLNLQGCRNTLKGKLSSQFRSVSIDTDYNPENLPQILPDSSFIKTYAKVNDDTVILKVVFTEDNKIESEKEFELNIDEVEFLDV